MYNSFFQVCSSHFIDGKPTSQNPNPVLNMGYEPNRKVTPGRRPLVKRNLFENLEVSVSGEKDKTLDINENDVSDVSDNYIYTATPIPDLNKENKVDSNEDKDSTIIYVCCHDGKNAKQCNRKYVDTSTQTEDPVKLDHAYAYLYPTKDAATQNSNPEFGMNKVTSDSDARFYTGLTLNVLSCLISSLKPYGQKLKYKMKIADQILLVLVRLRLGITMQDLGRRFQISTQLASLIFNTWIDIMAKHLTSCMTWLPRETIRRTLPSSFINTYPLTTCIIDCSEIFIQRPFSLKACAKTWSSYKSHNTAKFLIAIAPNGYIMYVSPLYGGRASDNFITKSCGFLNYLLPGDEVMADRGFTIAEDLCARRVKLNIPSFMKGRSQLSMKETIESRRIASVRIHVERAIARMKSYRLLNTTLHIRSLKKLDKIVRVVACLCNLHGPLIKRNSV